ncbi:unnamed protein product [Heterobilharzia americana]|nr:unnamed protein product [Heterobilharzia americana]
MSNSSLLISVTMTSVDMDSNLYAFVGLCIVECYEKPLHRRLIQVYQNGTGVPPNSFVLFFTYQEDPFCQGNLLAYASSCQNDPSTDRF